MESAFDTRRKLEIHGLVIVLFAGSLALGDYGIRFYISILNVSAPSRLVAGFTEPITTKLFPAIAVILVHQWKEIPISYLQSRPYWFAAIGGASVAAFERILYIVVKGAAVTPTFLVAPWMHVLNAVFIAGVLFAAGGSGDRRFLGKLVGVTVVAMAIHVFWNMWGVILVYRLFN